MSDSALRRLLVLLHYPVTNRKGELIATSVTNMDIHDLSRTARTYACENYYVVTPVLEQHRILERMLEHWGRERSRDWHPDRYEALSRLRLEKTFEDVLAHYARDQIDVVMPDARTLPGQVTGAMLKKRWANDPVSHDSCTETEMKIAQRPIKMIVLGTGWGIAPEFFFHVDTFMAPIYGPEGGDGYNHLSVRAAGAVILDRLFGVE